MLRRRLGSAGFESRSCQFSTVSEALASYVPARSFSANGTPPSAQYQGGWSWLWEARRASDEEGRRADVDERGRLRCPHVADDSITIGFTGVAASVTRRLHRDSRRSQVSSNEPTRSNFYSAQPSLLPTKRLIDSRVVFNILKTVRIIVSVL